METIVYRQDGGIPALSGTATSGVEGCKGEERLPRAPQDEQAWHPGIVYPCMSEAEMDIWAHWLPTAVVCSRVNRDLPGELAHTLTWLGAPPEVLEECRWSCALELFEAYEIRTPERRDLRDPLLIGRCGSQRYRVALWGESLRPFEEITALVQESLRLRKRAARWQALMMAGGTLLGLAFGLWLGSRPSFAGSEVGAGILFAFLGLLCTGLPAETYAPETQQQRFLDRYR